MFFYINVSTSGYCRRKCSTHHLRPYRPRHPLSPRQGSPWMRTGEAGEEDHNCNFIIGHDDAVKKNKVLAHEELEIYLRNCVRYHQLLLNEVKILDKVLKPIVTIKIMISTVFFAFTGILMTYSPDNEVVTFCVSCLMYGMMETGLLCWIATQLTIQSERVGEASYSLMWYEYPAKIKNSLKFIIARSQKSVTLSLGPFGTLSMELFARILNSAYSYFTLLRDFSKN